MLEDRRPQIVARDPMNAPQCVCLYWCDQTGGGGLARPHPNLGKDAKAGTP